MKSIDTFELIIKENKMNYKLTINKLFLNRFTKINPELLDFYTLVNYYNLSDYLHNINGPALINLVNNYEEYWIEGKNYNKTNFLLKTWGYQ